MNTKNRILGPDGLRGFAAAYIVFEHVLGLSYSTSHPTVVRMMTPFIHGILGVPLLLVLSGFVLTYTRMCQEEAGRPKSYGSHLLGRWLRIGLPYYVVLALYVLLSGGLRIAGVQGHLLEAMSLRQILTHVTFTHGFWSDTIHAIDPAFCTLAHIFQFYLLFPWLYLLMKRFGVWRVYGMSVVILCLWHWFLERNPDHWYLQRGVILSQGPCYLAGMGIAFWWERLSKSERRPLGELPLVIAGVGLLALGIVFRALDEVTLRRLSFASGYALLLAALESHRQSGWFDRLVSNRGLLWIGSFSYSLYLIHGLLLVIGLRACRAFLPYGVPAVDLLMMALVTPFAILGGYAFHLSVEKPLAAMGKRRGSRSSMSPCNERTPHPAATFWLSIWPLGRSLRQGVDHVMDSHPHIEPSSPRA